MKDEISVSSLPLCYASLTPLFSENHEKLAIRRKDNFGFARSVNAVPLLADEFAKAQNFFPIVFTSQEPRQPVALLGATSGTNEFVSEEGKWRDGVYIPAYLRRYPFALVREKTGSNKMLLCADLTSDAVADESDTEARLFEGSKPSTYAQKIINFCQKYEESLARTKAFSEELAKLDLFEESTVRVSSGDKVARLEGFVMVSEERLRGLDDKTLADLVRRGVTNLLSAHHFSVSQFSDLVQDTV